MNFPTNHRTGRVITAAALLPAILFAVSSHATIAVADAASGAPASIAAPKTHAASVDQMDYRITELHKKLRVTADEDAQWNDLAQVMRDNAEKLRDGVAERSTKLKGMNAVDDLKSYEKIADEHADGLKRLVPAFEALYDKMTPAQQKNADHVFAEQQKNAPRS